jgi:hypothetical protein
MRQHITRKQTWQNVPTGIVTCLARCSSKRYSCRMLRCNKSSDRCRGVQSPVRARRPVGRYLCATARRAGRTGVPTSIGRPASMSATSSRVRSPTTCQWCNRDPVRADRQPQLARHGRIRTRRARVVVSGSPHRRQANRRPQSQRMAGPPQQAPTSITPRPTGNSKPPTPASS